MDYKQEIEQLRQAIEENSRLYYDLDAPVISDYEYDAMMRRLRELEAPGTGHAGFTHPARGRPCDEHLCAGDP